jgi:serine/threonine protein kinase
VADSSLLTVVVVVVQVFRGILENDALKEFKAETHILRRLRHPNVILFMGTCTQKREMCIVTGTTSTLLPSITATFRRLGDFARSHQA